MGDNMDLERNFYESSFAKSTRWISALKNIFVFFSSFSSFSSFILVLGLETKTGLGLHREMELHVSIHLTFS